MHINPKYLMQMVEVVERGSLTEAAEALHMTQPALSRNMKELERQIGATLLIRDRQGARLTELGERALPYAQTLRTTLERVSIEVEAWQKGHVGSIQIGATPHPASLIPPILTQFLEHRPGVQALVAISGILPLIESLAKGELDLVIGPIGIEKLPEGLILNTLFTDELILIAGADHPLARRAEITVCDLEGARWIGTPSDSAMRRQVGSILVALGVRDVDTNIVVTGIENAVDLLAAGDHLAILPKRTLERAISRGTLVALPLELPIRQWPITILHHGAAELPKIVSDFVATLSEHLH